MKAAGVPESPKAVRKSPLYHDEVIACKLEMGRAGEGAGMPRAQRLSEAVRMFEKVDAFRV